eukprot:TRINITY_DN55655_c0_g1_i1.p1 TRINITY_DN55655_c0_g1~~TRINITY_DN55655_c0_g1_i1.p1  ORF type:complete len:895 (+),score=110.27 TRINITY_DN55655_c0_g1_i1:61-2745(+)
MASRLGNVHEHVNEKVGNILGAIGYASARRPFCALGSCFLCTILLLSGVLRYTSESETSKIWVAQYSDAKLNWEYIKDTFPQGGRFVMFLIEAKSKGSNALTKPVFDETWELFNEIQNVSVENQTIADMCIKLPSGDCLVTGALSFFRNSQDNYKARIRNDTDLLAALNVKRYPATGGEVRLIDVFGSYTLEGSPEKMTSAPVWMFTFLIDPAFEDKAELWEDGACHTVVDPKKKVVTREFSHISVQCFGSFGLNGELGRNVSNDVPLFMLAFVVIVAFAAFVLGKPEKCVESRKTLALFDALLIFGAIGAGFGFSMMCGVAFTAIQQILPFILMGIGFDDGFVIAKAFDCTNADDPVPDRMRDAMRKAGLSITLTTATNIFAFLLGSTASFYAIKYFCVYAALSIFFIYLYHLCGFSALLALDTARQQSRRFDVLCCLKSKSSAVVHPETHVVQVGSEEQKKESEEDHTLSLRNNAAESERISCEYLLVRGMEFVLARAACKVVILGVFAVWFGVALWLTIAKTSKDFQILDLVPDESYMRDFVNTERKYWDGADFQSRSPPTSLLFKDMDQSDPQVQAEMLSVESEFMNLSTIDASLGSSNWLAAFRAWALNFPLSKLTSANITQVNGKDFVAKKDFYPAVKAWLTNYPPAWGFSNSIVFDGDSIKASLIGFRHVTMTTSAEQVDCFNQMETFYKNKDGLLSNMVVSSVLYQYWHQYQIIQRELLQTIGLTLAVVLVTVFIGMGNVVAVVIVFVTMLSCFVDLMACIPIMGLALNSISVINLVMAVGLIIDYSMHIAHTFSEQDPSLSRNERTVLTMRAMGSPVLMGGLSTLVAVFPLGLASSQFFRVFFRMFLCIVVVGITHGLIFLPVVLSLVGTSAPKHVQKQEKDTAP